MASTLPKRLASHHHRYDQRLKLARVFMSMLIKYPETSQTLVAWWIVQEAYREEHPEYVIPVKAMLRPAFLDQWTSEMDDAVSTALLPTELCDLQCLFDSFDAAQRSLRAVPQDG